MINDKKMLFKLPKELHEDFVKTCQNLKENPSNMLRLLMAQYVKDNEGLTVAIVKKDTLEDISPLKDNSEPPEDTAPVDTTAKEPPESGTDTAPEDTEELKTCSLCKEEKPLSEFYYDKRINKHEARCRSCKYKGKTPQNDAQGA